MGSLDSEADSDGPGFQLNTKLGPSSLLLWPCLSELCCFLPRTALNFPSASPQTFLPTLHSLAGKACVYSSLYPQCTSRTIHVPGSLRYLRSLPVYDLLVPYPVCPLRVTSPSESPLSCVFLFDVPHHRMNLIVWSLHLQVIFFLAPLRLPA